MFSNTRT